MSATQAMKRIPRIKFPQRHPKPQGSNTVADEKVEIFRFGSTTQQKAPQSSSNPRSYRFSSEVPAPPSNSSVAGKASMLPKRTPLSEQEIEAIMLGGCI